jgi:hypothetical protein
MPWAGFEPTIPASKRAKIVHAVNRAATLIRPCTSNQDLCVSFLIRIVGGWVHTGSTRHVVHFWLIVHAPCDCEDGEYGGMKIGRGNRSSRRKPAPAPLCPPQIPLDQIQARTRSATVGSQLLTAWAMAQHVFICCWTHNVQHINY